MQYSRLGNTGLIVSRFAFGAMTFGSSEGMFGAISQVHGQDLADTLVGKALDGGINHFNTANMYTAGQSEIMLGKALGSHRKDVLISTKCGFRTGTPLQNQGLSRHHILQAADDSLRRLGTDYIDVYLVHRRDTLTPIEETVEALNDLVRSGKTRYVGFSNWNAWQAARAVGIQNQHGWAPFRAAELYYSLLGRDIEQELAPFAEDAGIGIFAWSPLAGGLLSGKYTRENPKPGGRLDTFDFLPYDKEKGWLVLDHLRLLAAAHRATPAQVALAWMLSKPFISSILLGANRVAQLDDNLAAMELKLSAEELKGLDEMTSQPLPYPNWFHRNTADTQVKEALSV